MNCICCDSPIDETAFGLNKKLLGKGVCEFYCVKCLAGKLHCTERDLYEKAEYLRKTGCCFFPKKTEDS